MLLFCNENSTYIILYHLISIYIDMTWQLELAWSHQSSITIGWFLNIKQHVGAAKARKHGVLNHEITWKGVAKSYHLLKHQMLTFLEPMVLKEATNSGKIWHPKRPVEDSIHPLKPWFRIIRLFILGSHVCTVYRGYLISSWLKWK